MDIVGVLSDVITKSFMKKSMKKLTTLAAVRNDLAFGAFE